MCTSLLVTKLLVRGSGLLRKQLCSGKSRGGMSRRIWLERMVDVDDPGPPRRQPQAKVPRTSGRNICAQIWLLFEVSVRVTVDIVHHISGATNVALKVATVY